MKSHKLNNERSKARKLLLFGKRGGLLNTAAGAGAVAGYSLRMLNNAMIGEPVIRVRRSSDNAEEDILLTFSAINTSQLLSFCGAGDGFVTTWYDQSGEGNHAVQSSASAQPKIVSDGAVVLNSQGNFSMLFEGSNYLNIGSVGISGTMSRSVISFVDQISNPVDAGGAYFGSSGSTSSGSLFDLCLEDNDFSVRVVGNSIYNNTVGSLIPLVATVTFGGTQASDATVHINGTNLVRNTGSDTAIDSFDNYNIGASLEQTIPYFNGYIGEILVYNSDKESVRTQIESNINNYYGVY